MRELAALLSSSGKAMVVVNCLNPGLCRSEIQRDIHSWKKHLARATTLLLARTAEVGGRTLVAGVTAGEASQGRYMDDGKLSKYAPGHSTHRLKTVLSVISMLTRLGHRAM